MSDMNKTLTGIKTGSGWIFNGQRFSEGLSYFWRRYPAVMPRKRSPDYREQAIIDVMKTEVMTVEEIIQERREKRKLMVRRFALHSNRV